jgi:hypothetical protein
MNRFVPTTAALLVLGLGSSAFGWPPGYKGDRSTAILPAHQTTMAYKMASRGGAVARTYHELQLRGRAQEAAAFAELHPFVQNTYGTKVPVIGISQGPGGAGSASGGVESNAALSAALQGKGPMPADLQAVTAAAKKAQQIAALEAQLAELKK